LAAASSAASRMTSMRLPIRTSLTPAMPAWSMLRATVLPWGSRSSLRGMTLISALNFMPQRYTAGYEIEPCGNRTDGLLKTTEGKVDQPDQDIGGDPGGNGDRARPGKADPGDDQGDDEQQPYARSRLQAGQPERRLIEDTQQHGDEDDQPGKLADAKAHLAVGPLGPHPGGDKDGAGRCRQTVKKLPRAG